MRMHKRCIGLALSLALVSVSSLADTKDTYPDRPIRWIVPYTPGGFTDTGTRLVTSRLSKVLGQPIFVENKPGANAMIGAEIVVKAAPDGYTLLSVLPQHAANITLQADRVAELGLKNLIPITVAAYSPLILTVSNAFAPNTVAELIAYAKANPGKLAFGSSGVGATAHLTTELLIQTTDIKMLHVPYKGTAPALVDLIPGNIQILVDAPSSMMTHVQTGKVKALGMFSAKRLDGAPLVPTIVESGGPPIEAASWVMFMAPPGTPDKIVNRIYEGVREVLSDPELLRQYKELLIIPKGGTPAETALFLNEEVSKWGQVITKGNIKVD